MDLTPYKNQLNALRQCIVNVELAQVNYRSALEAQSYGVVGASEMVNKAIDQLKTTEDTLRSQSRINCLLNQEVTS